LGKAQDTSTADAFLFGPEDDEDSEVAIGIRGGMLVTFMLTVSGLRLITVPNQPLLSHGMAMIGRLTVSQSLCSS